MFTDRVTLTGSVIRLRPLLADDASVLGDASADGEIWKLKVTTVPNHEGAGNYIAKALAGEAEGTMKPFATTLLATGQVIGSTRFWRWEEKNRSVEIGHTFLAQSHQRTIANTEAKYLMLRYAFETLDCVRVQFCTDILNERSQAAIQRIGAKLEGVLRKERIMYDGRIRDTVVFSIIQDEWPAVRALLESKLTGAGVRPLFHIQ